METPLGQQTRGKCPWPSLGQGKNKRKRSTKEETPSKGVGSRWLIERPPHFYWKSSWLGMTAFPLEKKQPQRQDRRSPLEDSCALSYKTWGIRDMQDVPWWKMATLSMRPRDQVKGYVKTPQTIPKSPALVPLLPAATVCTRSRHQELTVPFLIVLLKMSSRHHEYKYCSYSHTKKAIQIKQLNTKIRWNTWTPQWNSEH